MSDRGVFYLKLKIESGVRSCCLKERGFFICGWI